MIFLACHTEFDARHECSTACGHAAKNARSFCKKWFTVCRESFLDYKLQICKYANSLKIFWNNIRAAFSRWSMPMRTGGTACCSIMDAVSEDRAVIDFLLDRKPVQYFEYWRSLNMWEFVAVCWDLIVKCHAENYSDMTARRVWRGGNEMTNSTENGCIGYENDKI